jgi:hypothetical protein
MANFVYNVGLGRVAEKAADGATLKLLVLQSAASDTALKDLDTIASVLAQGGTTEATFTNYARATLGSVTVTVVDGSDRVDVDCSDVVFTAAGGAVNNTCTDVIIYEEVTNDGDSIPLVQLDASFTTDGNDVTLQFNAQGFYSAS